MFKDPVTVDWSIISDDKELNVLGAHLGQNTLAGRAAAHRLRPSAAGRDLLAPVAAGGVPGGPGPRRRLGATPSRSPSSPDRSHPAPHDRRSWGRHRPSLPRVGASAMNEFTRSESGLHVPKKVTRRSVLAAMGGAATVPMLYGCGVGTGGGDEQGSANGAGEVTGSFDWKALKGESVKILQTPHPYQQAFQPLLKEFTELTGIEVQADLVAEADYFTKLNTELAGKHRRPRRLHDRRLLHLAVRSPRLDGGPHALDRELRGDQPRLRLRGHLRGPAHLHALGLREGFRARHAAGSGPSRGASRPTSSPTTRRSSTRAASPAGHLRRLHPARHRPHRPLAEPLRRRLPRLEVLGDDPPRAS